MSDEFKQPCYFCGKDIDVKWDNGAILPDDCTLIADYPVHNTCFEKDWDDYMKKRDREERKEDGHI